MEIRTIGIDLGKTVFHLVGVSARGDVVVRKKCSRLQVLRFTSSLRSCLIGMEACGGSHFLGRALRDQGHDVRLMPAQYVKPYVKTNKNDYIDAEAISEAVTRPSMRFVPIKTDDQLDLQSMHRVRERWVGRRTAVINQIRGLLLERGITVRKGIRHIEESLPGILEDPDNKLSGALRVLLGQGCAVVRGLVCNRHLASVRSFAMQRGNASGSQERHGVGAQRSCRKTAQRRYSRTDSRQPPLRVQGSLPALRFRV